LEGEWEALAVGIAHNKAVDAYRASQKGLRGTEHRDRLYLVSGDAEMVDLDGETKAPLFEVLPGDWEGPEVECEQVEKALMLRDLAREVLDERERRIVFAILFQGYSRREVAEELDLTSQRVGQIFLNAMKRLETDPNNPFKLEDIQEGGDQ
jgi:RNA polymerase sigma factor (sigma-70 family)